jgi:TATA-box binding protein (TBP) (component of TFIID and TFIIIB)
MDIRLTNVVVRSSLNCSVNLTLLVNSIANAVYNTKKYSGMVWRHRHIKSTCFVFHTGKLMCMGNNSVKGAKKDLRKYARIINKFGYNVCLSCIKVMTKSAVATLTGKLNLEEASKLLSGSYEPEIFIAMLIRRGTTNFTCFRSGKVIITGVKKLNNLVDLLSELEMFTL